MPPQDEHQKIQNRRYEVKKPPVKGYSSPFNRCECKKSVLHSQESGDRDQESVKTKSYEANLFLNYLFLDFLQMHHGGEHVL